jgi:dipeptidyl aminopeptidase B
MTSKVVEADDGVFSVGMAVAPVTDWKFYGVYFFHCYVTYQSLNSQLTDLMPFRFHLH